MSDNAISPSPDTMVNNAANNGQDENDDYYRIASTIKFIVEGVGIAFFGSIGLVINSIALFILFRKKVLRTFHMLMCCLVMYDFFHNIFDIICFALPEFSSTYRYKALLRMVPVVIPLTQISMTGSCYTTIAIATERFLSIKYPFFVQRRNIKTKIFLIPVFVYAIVYNIPRFFEFEVLNIGCHSNENGSLDQEDNSSDCEVLYKLQATELRSNSFYVTVYVNTMNLLFNMIFPFVTMGTMNYMIYRGLNKNRSGCQSATTNNANGPQGSSRGEASNNASPFQSNGRGPNGRNSRSEGDDVIRATRRSSNPQQIRRNGDNNLRKREVRITRASVAITVFFVICHIPRCVPNLVEIFVVPKDFPWWMPIMVNINHLLITINSAFNFLFYLSYCWRPNTKVERNNGNAGGQRRPLNRRIERNELHAETGTTSPSTPGNSMRVNGSTRTLSPRPPTIGRILRNPN